jgi:single stranded DNA-binding protein
VLPLACADWAAPGWLVKRSVPRRRPGATPPVQASASSGPPSRGTHTCLPQPLTGGGYLTQQPPGPQTGTRKEAASHDQHPHHRREPDQGPRAALHPHRPSHRQLRRRRQPALPSTPRTNAWEETTSFFDVVAWGTLAENLADSLRRGDRVVVEGRLDQRSWENNQGEKRSKIEITANEVAPSLRWATAESPKPPAHGPNRPRRPRRQRRPPRTLLTPREAGAAQRRAAPAIRDRKRKKRHPSRPSRQNPRTDQRHRGPRLEGWLRASTIPTSSTAVTS